MYEEARGAAWIQQQLTNNTVLTDTLQQYGANFPGIYHRFAPPNTPLPYVVYMLFGGQGDVRTANNKRVWSNQMWRIKYITPEDDDEKIEAVMDLIDQSLDRQRGVILDGVVLDCTRERTMSMIEPANDQQILHAIAEFTLLVQVP